MDLYKEVFEKSVREYFINCATTKSGKPAIWILYMPEFDPLLTAFLENFYEESFSSHCNIEYVNKRGLEERRWFGLKEFRKVHNSRHGFHKCKVENNEPIDINVKFESACRKASLELNIWGCPVFTFGPKWLEDGIMRIESQTIFDKSTSDGKKLIKVIYKDLRRIADIGDTQFSNLFKCYKKTRNGSSPYHEFKVLDETKLYLELMN